MSGEFVRIPHYATWDEYYAAAKQHRFDDFAAWQVSHAAWMARERKGQVE